VDAHRSWKFRAPRKLSLNTTRRAGPSARASTCCIESSVQSFRFSDFMHIFCLSGAIWESPIVIFFQDQMDTVLIHCRGAPKMRCPWAYWIIRHCAKCGRGGTCRLELRISSIISLIGPTHFGPGPESYLAWKPIFVYFRNSWNFAYLGRKALTQLAGPGGRQFPGGRRITVCRVCLVNPPLQNKYS